MNSYWHTGCFVAYLAACGRPLGPDHVVGQDHYPKRILDRDHIRCVDCEKGLPLDIEHRVSLAFAFEIGDRNFVRAFDTANVQLMCREHHRLKTTADMSKIRWLRAAKDLGLSGATMESMGKHLLLLGPYASVEFPKTGVVPTDPKTPWQMQSGQEMLLATG